MSIFKCKMCGGTLEISENQTVVECDYCGTQQTLPRLNDERKANLYDRANHFRRNNEFDKAMSIYESILNEDNMDAEAYWSLVLCRYGIEYVEDPATHKRVPTVNRAQFTSIFDDDNYKSALENADMSQRAIYEAEAKAINEIQKGILAISQKEEPFDVFICYKETDNNGRRTPDSVLANDLYHQLVQEGFKVFFSRITLEDKLGTAYEPYIFAALNSAKVMVVLGTRPEYFKAVWVKNEWSRYLSLVKQSGGKKVLIPAYKDMDPYDLPEEFSHLQAQDMGKLGFMQDLIRGIKKLTQVEAPKVTVKETVIASGNANVAPLLKRAFIYLEDGDWQSANDYCERVLDQDPENAEAYIGKLMAELKCRKQEQLKDQAEPFDGKGAYNKAIRFGSSQLKATLESYNTHIRNRNENTRLEKLYNSAVYQKSNAATEKAYLKAAELFAQISAFKDARLLADECRELAKEAEYQRALKLIVEGSEKGYRSAAEVFDHICGYKDAELQAKWCLEQAEAARIEAQYSLAQELETDGDKLAGEKEFSRAIDCFERAIKEYSAIPEKEEACQHIAECNEKISNTKLDLRYFAATGYESSVNKQGMSYAQKISELNKAIAIYQEIGQWKDSHDRIQSCKSQIDELEEKKQKELEEAEQLRIRKEEDARRRAKKRKNVAITVAVLGCLLTAFVIVLNTVIIPMSKYNNAISLMEKGEYQEAITVLEKVEWYGDSVTQIEECKNAMYESAVALIDKGEYDSGISALQGMQQYKESELYIKYANAKKQLNNLHYVKGAAVVNSFIELGQFKDSEAQVEIALRAWFDSVQKNIISAGLYDKAIAEITKINQYADYSDELEKIYKIQYDEAMELIDNHAYDLAEEILSGLTGYFDADEQLEALDQKRYDYAMELYSENDFETAALEFIALIGYKDSADKATACLAGGIINALSHQKLIDAVEFWELASMHSLTITLSKEYLDNYYPA